MNNGGGPAQKTPLVATLPRLAAQTAVKKIQQTGKALPCAVVSVSPNSAIVTVKFEVTGTETLPNVTIPVAGSVYVREPIQPGDLGMVIPADVYLGGVSGLGGGVADMTRRGNLTALAFQPLSNVAWAALVLANALQLQGPDGVVLQDMGGLCKFVLTPDGIEVYLPSGGAIEIGNVTITADDVIVNGVSFKAHFHGGVMTGGGNTGPPI